MCRLPKETTALRTWILSRQTLPVYSLDGTVEHAASRGDDMKPEMVIGGGYIDDGLIHKIVIWTDNNGKTYYPVIEMPSQSTVTLRYMENSTVCKVIDKLMDVGIEPDWTDIYKDYDTETCHDDKR